MASLGFFWRGRGGELGLVCFGGEEQGEFGFVFVRNRTSISDNEPKLRIFFPPFTFF